MAREVTPKQKEIAALVQKGKPNKDIARELGMSENTLRIHQQHIRQITGKKDTKEAAAAIVSGNYGAAGPQKRRPTQRPKPRVGRCAAVASVLADPDGADSNGPAGQVGRSA